MVGEKIMNLICFIFGPKMKEIWSATDNNPPSMPGWKFTKSITLLLLCYRCCFTFQNKTNFGEKLKENNENGT